MAQILFPDENMTDPSLRSSIIARTPFSGIIHGFNGVYNGISVKTTGNIRGVFGGDKGDNIFLSEVESILVIHGGEGEDRLHLQVHDELHRGLDMEVDFQLGRIKFNETRTDFVTMMKGIDLFVGREHSFEKVILGCGTRSVQWADVVSIRNSTCGYNVKIEVGDSTRVMFDLMEEVKSEEKEDDEDNKGTCSKDKDDDCDEDEKDDDTKEESYYYDEEETISETFLEPSIFHYHFTSVRSFDIEVDSFRSLHNTTHIFYLNFNLANLTSIHFSLNESRLIYSTSHNSSLEYSHLVGKLDDTAMFYSQPEFMSRDGFHLRITRYGEIKAVLGAWNETLDLNFIHQAIPILAAQSERLGIGFILETATQFIYAGSTKEEEVDILTNWVNTTSHLIGWNGTTYEIIDMSNDTWIHPQQTDVQDAMHVIDLSNIVSQIRNETGQKYIPEVRENGTHLKIMMTNFTDKYPARVIIANGTLCPKSLVVLLNSIAMEIMPDIPPIYGIGEEMKWKIKPRPILIPDGHTYILAAEDLEEDVLVESDCEDKEHHIVTLARDNYDLVIISKHIDEDSMEVGRYTSFVIFEFYKSGQEDMDNGNENSDYSRFEKVGAIRNLRIRLGQSTVKISSNVPIVDEETGQEIHVGLWEDVLQNMEEGILKDFPDMPRRFKKVSADNLVSLEEGRHTTSNLRDEL